MVLRWDQGGAGPLGSKTPPLEISLPNKRLWDPAGRLSSRPRGGYTLGLSELRNGASCLWAGDLPRTQQGAS